MASVLSSTSSTVPVLVLVLVALLRTGDSSEFPERECCDSIPDGGLDPVPTLAVDIIWPPPNPANPHPPTSTETATRIDQVVATIQSAGGGGGQQHPDTNNFLFPEFIPELSLDLGYPMPHPPLHPYHHLTPEAGNNVPTTTGTGKASSWIQLGNTDRLV